MSKQKRIMLALLSLMFVGSGLNHFLSTDFYMPMMPDYLPMHRELIWISGVIELILGIAIWPQKTRRLVAWGMIGLVIAVFPAHVHMYMHPERFPDIPEIALLLRMPMQGLFGLWAWWYTRP